MRVSGESVHACGWGECAHVQGGTHAVAGPVSTDSRAAVGEVKSGPQGLSSETHSQPPPQLRPSPGSVPYWLRHL